MMLEKHKGRQKKQLKILLYHMFIRQLHWEGVNYKTVKVLYLLLNLTRKNNVEIKNLFSKSDYI